jgi:hypothetical protein
MARTVMRRETDERAIDTSAEREIEIFHGPFVTFFSVFLINDLLAWLLGFFLLTRRDF